MNFIPRFIYRFFFKQENTATVFSDRQLFSLKVTIFLTFTFKAIFYGLSLLGDNKSPHIPTNAVTIIVSCIPAFYFLQTNRIAYAKFFAYFPTIIVQTLSSYYVLLEGLPYGNAELALLPYVTACILFYSNPIAFYGVALNILFFITIKIVRFNLYHLSSHELSLDLTMSITAYIAVIIITNLYKSDFFTLQKNNETLNTQKEIIESQAENLQEINSTKDKLFAILSHDLRSPVGSLKNYMMLVDWGALSQKEFAASAQGLNTQLSNVNTMLENVLNWSVSQMGGMQPNVEPTLIFNIIEEQIKLLASVAEAKQIQIINQISTNTKLLIDKNHLAIIVRNLLQNALKFTNFGGEVYLDSIEKEGFGEIIVKDNGIGMSEERLSNLFKIEKNTSRTGTAQEQGTGLGLVLVKDLVEANGGFITVKSILDEGTTFTVKFKLP